MVSPALKPYMGGLSKPSKSGEEKQQNKTKKQPVGPTTHGQLPPRSFAIEAW